VSTFKNHREPHGSLVGASIIDNPCFGALACMLLAAPSSRIDDSIVEQFMFAEDTSIHGRRRQACLRCVQSTPHVQGINQRNICPAPSRMVQKASVCYAVRIRYVQHSSAPRTRARVYQVPHTGTRDVQIRFKYVPYYRRFMAIVYVCVYCGRQILYSEHRIAPYIIDIAAIGSTVCSVKSFVCIYALSSGIYVCIYSSGRYVCT
jgi:hypothetical protein